VSQVKPEEWEDAARGILQKWIIFPDSPFNRAQLHVVK